MESGSLKNEVAIVTGAGEGIGRAIAAALAGEGAAVLLNDVDGRSAQRAAEEIRAGGGRCEAAAGDVADVDVVREPGRARRRALRQGHPDRRQCRRHARGARSSTPIAPPSTGCSASICGGSFFLAQAARAPHGRAALGGRHRAHLVDRGPRRLPWSCGLRHDQGGPRKPRAHAGGRARAARDPRQRGGARAHTGAAQPRRGSRLRVALGCPHAVGPHRDPRGHRQRGGVPAVGAQRADPRPDAGHRRRAGRSAARCRER